jgi:hypothetical protein
MHTQTSQYSYRFQDSTFQQCGVTCPADQSALSGLLQLFSTLTASGSPVGPPAQCHAMGAPRPRSRDRLLLGGTRRHHLSSRTYCRSAQRWHLLFNSDLRQGRLRRAWAYRFDRGCPACGTLLPRPFQERVLACRPLTDAAVGYCPLVVDALAECFCACYAVAPLFKLSDLHSKERLRFVLAARFYSGHPGRGTLQTRTVMCRPLFWRCSAYTAQSCAALAQASGSAVRRSSGPTITQQLPSQLFAEIADGWRHRPTSRGIVAVVTHGL